MVSLPVSGQETVNQALRATFTKSYVTITYSLGVSVSSLDTLTSQRSQEQLLVGNQT